MKPYLLFFLSISPLLNIYLGWKKTLLTKKDADLKILTTIKKIDCSIGIKMFKNKLASESYSKNNKKLNVIYFWDSLDYDNTYCNSLKVLDSLAGHLGRYNFNYIFATEMQENISKDFLKRKNLNISNFKIWGNMDDFISSVYNKKPAPFDKYILNGKTIKQSSNDIKIKRKGYYLIMDDNGEVLYYNYRFRLPTHDTEFMNKLTKLNEQIKLKILN